MWAESWISQSAGNRSSCTSGSLPTRHHRHPVGFYRDYHGVVVTDGLQQYHLTEKELEGFTNANCWTHARRFFADAVKAMGKSNAAVRRSTAFQALTRIAAIYKLEEALKDLSPEERLKERQKNIRSLVEEYFAWAKALMSGTTVLPKGKTAKGLNYSINQEKYLKVFLDDGEVPIDNSAALSEGITYPHLFPESDTAGGFPEKRCA